MGLEIIVQVSGFTGMKNNTANTIDSTISDNIFGQIPRGGGGGGVLGSVFAGYVPLASQNPYPIIIYSLANY